MSWAGNPFSLWHCCQDFFHLINVFTAESWTNWTLKVTPLTDIRLLVPDEFGPLSLSQVKGLGWSSSLQRHCQSLSLVGKEDWVGRRALIAGIQKAALDTGHQPCSADSRCWISQSCLWFEKSSAFYRYLLITLNTPRPCLCIFEGNVHCNLNTK